MTAYPRAPRLQVAATSNLANSTDTETAIAIDDGARHGTSFVARSQHHIVGSVVARLRIDLQRHQPSPVLAAAAAQGANRPILHAQRRRATEVRRHAARGHGV